MEDGVIVEPRVARFEPHLLPGLFVVGGGAIHYKPRVRTRECDETMEVDGQACSYR